VHHQLVVDEVETVRTCFVRLSDHILDCRNIVCHVRAHASYSDSPTIVEIRKCARMCCDCSVCRSQIQNQTI
jgi:hypothetical protein